MKYMIFFFSLFCITAGMSQPSMMYGDTDRLGRPFSKDPHVINWQGGYLMYFSIPPGPEDGRWALGIARSSDLTTWEKVGEITPASDATYESKGMAAPGAIIMDGKVHLFYQTYGNGADDAICHAFSDDGINFIRNPRNPVFSPQGDWNCGRAIDAEVIPYKGRFFLYFATRDKTMTDQMMGVAVADDTDDLANAKWKQAADRSILLPELEWEGRCIEAASVTEKNGRLYMFYGGAYNNAPQQIGVAVSDDGINWERLSDEPFLPNGGPGEWNSSESGHPHIFTDRTDGRTYLFYQGNNDGGRTWYISKKEVVWEDGIPVLAPH